MENYKKLDSETAYQLLTEGIIKEAKDLKEDKNRWILHCLYSGIAAGRIAERMGLDSDYATALGYIHDIGRRISHPKHIIEGYYYMNELGYEKEARICLTHSFINNDITLAAGPFPSESAYKMINSHLNEAMCNSYDNIIQLCDLFCLETGFTTLEKRILDISLRKGVFPCSKRHFKKALELKEKIEKEIGCNLYELFPEIPQEDLKEEQEYLNKLEALFESVNFTPLTICISKDNVLAEDNKSYYLDKLLRDGHQVIFLSEEEISNNPKDLQKKGVDIIYKNTATNWGELTEIGIPCFLIEPNHTEQSIPKISSWTDIYDQVSAIASNENITEITKKSSNSNILVKK